MSMPVRQLVGLLVCVSALTVGSPLLPGTGSPTVTATTAPSIGISPGTPPENAAIEHQIELETDLDAHNGTFEVVVADAYEGEIDDPTLGAANESRFTELSASVVDGTDGDGVAETVRVQYRQTTNESARAALTLSVTLTHPPVNRNRTYELTLDRNGTTTATTTYTVRAITDGRTGRTGAFDTRTGQGLIYPGATIYQGESDIRFTGNLTPPLLGTAPEAAALTPPVATDQRTGAYTNDGTNESSGVHVVTPSVNRLVVRNAAGEKIGGGTLQPRYNRTVTVEAKYNYAQAEAIEVVVRTDAGLEVTGEVIEGAPVVADQSGTATWQMRVPHDLASSYTIAVGGVDDLDHGEARAETTITVGGDGAPSVDWASTAVHRGETVRFDLSGVSRGRQYLLTIDRDAFRDDATPTEILANLSSSGDIVETGGLTPTGERYTTRTISTARDATLATVYLQLDVEDATGQATGLVNTERMVAAEHELSLYAAGTTPRTLGAVDSPVATDPIAVRENDVAINPPGRYPIGAERSLTGEATAGIDDVAVYVRNEGRFELVDLGDDDGEITATTTVTDGDFETESTVLTVGDGPGNELLGLPGSYRIAVVGLTRHEDGSIARSITRRSLQQYPHAIGSIAVRRPAIELTTVTQGGEIPVTDPVVDVRGRATAADTVVLVAVDSRGQRLVEQLSVSNGTYKRTELRLNGLTRGRVDLFVLSAGLDGRFGDGQIGTQRADDAASLVEFVSGLDGRTATQVRAGLRAETVNASGSDDRLGHDRLRIADSRIAIEQVREQKSGNPPPVAGDATVVISGETNLRPESRRIELLVITPTNRSVVRSTTDWSNGTWSVTLPLEPYETGVYTVRPDTDVEVIGPIAFTAVWDLLPESQTSNITSPTSSATGGEAVSGDETSPAPVTELGLATRPSQPTVDPGRPVAVSYRITNPGEAAYPALLELLVLPSGVGIEDFEGAVQLPLGQATPPRVLSTPIDPGDTVTVTVTFSTDETVSQASDSGAQLIAARATLQAPGSATVRVNTTLAIGSPAADGQTVAEPVAEPATRTTQAGADGERSSGPGHTTTGTGDGAGPLITLLALALALRISAVIARRRR